jgi:hypothetical protein
MASQNIEVQHGSQRTWYEWFIGNLHTQGHLIFGIGLVIGGVLVSNRIATQQQLVLYEVKEGISIFAVLFIMAQAIERLLEPFTHILPGQDKPTEGDNCEAISADLRRKRSNIIWAMASLLGMLSSAYLGVFLLHAIGVASAPPLLDIAVTGMAIGAGTKPLHDLISKIEKSKNN